jgi:predicted NBD/HSP70 family sugar kinase
MAQVLVGVDLGGTNVRIGVVTPKGRVLKKEEYALDPSQGGLKIVEGLVSNLKISSRNGKNNQLLGSG